LPDDKNVDDLFTPKAGKKTSRKLSKKVGKRGRMKVAKGAGPRAKGWARLPGQPLNGTARTERAACQLASIVIAECAKYPRREDAKCLGIEPFDLTNLIAGNRPGIRLVMRLITGGRIDPKAVILKHKIKHLPPNYDLCGARVDLIAERVRLIAKSFDAARLAHRTGLPIHTIYQHRKLGHPVGLVTLLAYIDAGASPNYLFLGAT